MWKSWICPEEIEKEVSNIENKGEIHSWANLGIRRLLLFSVVFILFLGGCTYTGKSKTYDLSAFRQPGNHKIPADLELIIKSNKQIIQDIAQKKKNQWLRFVVIGDTVSNQNRAYRTLLSKISRLDPPPEFIINLGDFVLGKPESFSFYFDTIKYYPHPILHIMGNHEISHEGERISNAIFGERDYFFDYHDLRLIFMGTAKCGLTAERLGWLEDKLKVEYPDKKIFFMHKYPTEPFKEVFHGIYSFFSSKIKNEELLLDLLDEYDVVMAFFGHLHRYYEKIFRGTLMVINGGGGQRRFLEPPAKEPLSTKDKQFALVDIKTEGDLQGVLSCINKNGIPLFVSSFFQSERNENSDEINVQKNAFSASDDRFTYPQYIYNLYKPFQEIRTSRKGHHALK